MKKNTFDASAVVLGLSFVADSVNGFWPRCSAEPTSASWTLSQIGREADLLFKTVDVLGVVPNQLASIAQATDEAVCSCRSGAFSDRSHFGNAPVEERPSLGIKEDRGIEKLTVASGISAIF